MNKTYFELTIWSKNALELFKEFVFELGVSAIEEKEDCFIIRDEESLENLEFALKEYKKSLEEALDLELDLTISLEEKENRDWIDEYKKGVKPIEVDEIYIHPSWDESKEGFINIIIDPALAFGSGHHESTNMCLSLIQKYKNGYKTALDVGCGSGILSIALAKLGLNTSACDTDSLAVSSTKENALKNSVSLNEIWTGSIASLDKKYDLVVANLIADIILMLKKELIKSVEKNGVLIMSGVLDRYEEIIKAEFKELELVEVLQKNEWLSFVYRKK
ncbi:MAG: 50S ribosomal protein L11 methyltransferase [Campylobacteraceae bacterium]|nr:50S ribosomal protein L11 methyltransferase [Campylobacteraceae bacterium]